MKAGPGRRFRLRWEGHPFKADMVWIFCRLKRHLNEKLRPKPEFNRSRSNWACCHVTLKRWPELQAPRRPDRHHPRRPWHLLRPLQPNRLHDAAGAVAVVPHCGGVAGAQSAALPCSQERQQQPEYLRSQAADRYRQSQEQGAVQPSLWALSAPGAPWVRVALSAPFEDAARGLDYSQPEPARARAEGWADGSNEPRRRHPYPHHDR